MTFAKWSEQSEVFAYKATSGHYTVIVQNKDGFKSYHEKDLANLKERLKLLRDAGVKVEKAAIDLVGRLEREGDHETWDYSIRQRPRRNRAGD